MDDFIENNYYGYYEYAEENNNFTLVRKDENSSGLTFETDCCYTLEITENELTFTYNDRDGYKMKLKIKETISLKFNKSELNVLIRLLKEAGQEFSNHCCNEFEVEETEENKALLRDVMKDNEIILYDGKLIMHDDILFDYFAERLTKVLRNN